VERRLSDYISEGPNHPLPPSLPPSLPPYLPQVLVSLQEEHVLPPIAAQHRQSPRALLGGEDEDGGGEGLDPDHALVRSIGAWGREGGREGERQGGRAVRTRMEGEKDWIGTTRWWGR